MSHGLVQRISLRRHSIAALDDEAAFDLIWFPAPFIPRDVVEAALPRVARALKPGGMLIFGMYAARPCLLGRAVTDLLMIRSGGHPWRDEEIAAHAYAAGLSEVEFVDMGSVRFTFGQCRTV